MGLSRNTAIMLAAGPVLVGLVAAVPASVAAARPSVKYVTQVGGYGTAKARSVTVKCPAGYRVTGGGGFVEGAVGSAVLSEARPFHSKAGDGFVTTWQRDEYSSPSRWRAGASAVCAKGLSGVRIVSSTAKPNPGGHARREVGCPSGTRALGFGGRITGAPRQMVLTGFGPAKEGRGAYAVTDHTGEDSVPPWRLSVYAVCAKPPAGLRTKTWTSPSGLAQRRSHHVYCPSGTRPYGVGAATLGRTGQTEQLISDFGAKSGAGTWATADFQSGAFDRYAWRLRVTAVCAR